MTLNGHDSILFIMLVWDSTDFLRAERYLHSQKAKPLIRGSEELSQEFGSLIMFLMRRDI
jgi:hypothetical protein